MGINKEKNEYLMYICVFATGIVFLINMVLEILYGLPSFDGAMNLQVPYSLLNNGKWMTTYDGGIMFDNKIQTRMPVLFPIFLLWKIMGIHVETAILVNVLYIFLLLISVWLVGKTVGIRKEFNYCLLLLILTTPFFNEFSLGIYGEIPTLALFVISVVMLLKSEKIQSRRWYVYSGIFYSLACLNKTVILIALPSYIFIFLIKLLWDKSIRIKDIFLWAGTYILPIVLFELFHLIQMGGVRAYINGWKIEILDIVQQAGVVEKYNDTPNIFIKFWVHINIFCDDFGFKLGPVVFIILLASVFIYWIYRFFVKKEHTYYTILVLVMCSYFGWWTIISTTAMAWPRRILIGVILLKMVIVYDSSLIVERKTLKIVPKVILLCISIFFMVVTIRQCTNIDRNTKSAVESMSDVVKEIDEKEKATFYGFGWWQAPLVSFASGTNFYNLENVSQLPENAYLVVDFYANALAADELNDVLQKYHADIIEEGEYGCIYKLTLLSEDEITFSTCFDEIVYDKVSERYDAEEEYIYIDGIYDYETDNHIRWASPLVEIVLNKNENSNILKLNIAAVNIENMSDKTPILYVVLDGEVIRKIYLRNGGHMEISIPVPEEHMSGGVKDIHLFLNTKIENDNGDERDLGYLFEYIGFENE